MKVLKEQSMVFWVILVSLYTFFAFTGCAGIKIPKFKAHITLPASEDGYWVTTTTTEKGRIPKAEWAVKRKRGIILLKEDWAILRNSFLEQCLSQKSCKDAVGVFDDLFYAIDNALGQLPRP